MTDMLSLALQKKKFGAMDEWFRSVPGDHVAHFFKEELHAVRDLLSGDIILQLGCAGENRFCQNSGFRRHWIASPHAFKHSSFVSVFHQLPVDRHSIDCILAPLTLDAFPDNTDTLNEIDRVLKPGGYAVFFGINPFSLWGIWLKYSRHGCFGEEGGKAHVLLNLKRSMVQRGFVQCYLSLFYYIPPLEKEIWIERLDFLNQAGKILAPLPAGFYCIVFQKFNECITPLRIKTAKEKYIPGMLPSA